jgi:hypothetical protein
MTFQNTENSNESSNESEIEIENENENIEIDFKEKFTNYFSNNNKFPSGASSYVKVQLQLEFPE